MQSRAALAQQPWQSGACQLINDLCQIDRGVVNLQHGDACRPQRLKIIWTLSGSSDDHDCATDSLGWCGNVWIKISTCRYDHQGWIWGEPLLLPNAELPWFKINGAIALNTDGVGANQNCIGQRSLQGKDLMITCSVDGAGTPIGTLNRAVE